MAPREAAVPLNSLQESLDFIRDEEAPKTVAEWTTSKQKRDGIPPGLWRVHDGLYDLTEFASKHPGGKFWINATKGTDITEAFEVSHVFKGETHEKLLAKYFVRSCEEIPRQHPYTFKEDGFYLTLKRRVQPVLKKIGTGPNKAITVMQDGLFAGYLLTLFFTIYSGSFLMAVLTGLILGATCSCSHNFFHQRDNWRMYLFSLSGMLSQDWRISHAVSHHLYTNTVSDVESTALLPYLNYFPFREKNFVQRVLAPIYYQLLFVSVIPMQMASRVVLILKDPSEFVPEQLIPLLELVLFLTLSPLGLAQSFQQWLAIRCLCGYWITMLSITTTHHHPSVYHAGDKPSQDADWGLRQLDTTRDVDKKSNLFWISTTFGDHVLHHLFPTVDHSKLFELYPAFYETCKEFGVSYPFAGKLDMLHGMHRQLARTVPNTYQERNAMRTNNA